MRLGIATTLGKPISASDLIVHRAKTVEANGFGSVWFFDFISRSSPSIDPLISASIAAANGHYLLQRDSRNAAECLANLCDDDSVVAHHGEGELDFAATRALPRT